LLVLNQPETSLHPDLLPALGRLIAGTAERSQVLVVSHALALIDAHRRRRSVAPLPWKSDSARRRSRATIESRCLAVAGKIADKEDDLFLK
jgi:predicted ATPase